jgi:electron transfer flavoprotein beta subunit
MNIAVCIKQVPDTPNIRMDKERMSIIRDGVESIVNPLDAVALDAALALRDEEGGKVVVLTMGPPQSEEALREALAAGADEAILISDPRFAGADTLATSRTLAKAISRLSPFPDIIFCGKQSIDSDTGHVGPQIAEELDLPQACGVMEIHTEGSSLIVRQVSDGFLNTLRVTLPALLTVSHELSVPRFLPFGDIERAFSTGRIAVGGWRTWDWRRTRWGLQDRPQRFCDSTGRRPNKGERSPQVPRRSWWSASSIDWSL